MRTRVIATGCGCGRLTVMSNQMHGPGDHEDNAVEYRTDADAAQVHALLAIASAINRLADVLDHKLPDR